MDAKIFSLVVFLAAYALFIFLPNKRAQVAMIGAFVLLLFKVISPADAFWAVNWNVMGIFVGTLVLADAFMASRVPAYITEIIVNTSKSTAWAILLICIMTGFISAFVENVATVLIVAPIALSLAKKLDISPVKMLIAIAISSNLQGAATLIGDPPSMLLGGFANMNFGDFFFFKGRPSIFWAVELGALFSFVVLYQVFRKYKSKVHLVRVEKVSSWFPTILLVSLIATLAFSSFFDHGFPYASGSICLLFGSAGIIWGKFRAQAPIIKGLRALDWETALFLVGVFVLVGSISLTGWVETLSAWLSGMVGKDIFIGYTVIVFFSVAASAFIDNVPFLATMLPVAMSMSNKLGIDPSLFLFGLLIGASIGGNITPIGASANIVACSLLKKEGRLVGFMEFIKIGLPFTLAAVIPAYLFIWSVWR